MIFHKLKYRIYSAVFMAAIIGAGEGVAQSRSAYFMDNYTYGYQLNPSFGGHHAFVALSPFSNLNFGIASTLDMNKFIYNVNGKTTTFMNPDVSASKFLNSLPEKSRINFSTKLGILGFGFKSFGGYSTFSVNLVANANIGAPKSLFSLLKEGVSNRTYDISQFGAQANAYAEVGIGHSHDINERLRIGATLKFLVGGANFDAEFKNANLTLGEDSWSITSNALVQTSMKGLTYTHSVNNNTNHEYVDGADIDNAGISGYGLAVDLGATYKLTDELTLSAALLDIGGISWNNNMVATTNGAQTFETGKYTFSVDKNADDSFDNEFDRIGDDITALYELEDAGDAGSRFKMLGATMNIGAQYKLPFYHNLSFGLLNTTRFQGDFSWTEFRLSANLAPIRQFALGANVAYGTYGTAFGWLVNFNAFFIGMDYTVVKFAKDYVPMTSSAQLHFGTMITF